jgi:hypothetical protein
MANPNSAHPDKDGNTLQRADSFRLLLFDCQRPAKQSVDDVHGIFLGTLSEQLLPKYRGPRIRHRENDRALPHTGALMLTSPRRDSSSSVARGRR